MTAKWLSRLLLTLLAVGLLSSAGLAEVRHGRLEDGDAIADDGSYYDEYTFSARRGSSIEILLTSNDFDTYLIVISPSGETMEDDDGGGGTNSGLLFEAEESGEFTVVANSYAAGATGRYDLQVDGGGPLSMGSGATMDDDEDEDDGDDVVATGDETRVNGELDEDDQLHDDGSYFDAYSLTVRRGETIQIDLTSDDFDTYLVVLTPSENELENDDGGDGTNSSLTFEAEESGECLVVANSYHAGATGEYELVVTGGSDLVPTTIDFDDYADDIDDNDYGYDDEDYETGLSCDDPLEIEGALERGDSRADDGAYIDYYTFNASRNDEIEIALNSDDFDTYLILETPDGETLRDDDGGEGLNSLLQGTAEASGEYRIGVTSYSSNATGDYELAICGVDDVEAIEPEPSNMSDAQTSETGSLDENDELCFSREGCFVDYYSFSLDRGDEVEIELNSEDFDTYLILDAPSGAQTTNDDGGEGANSLILTTADQSGDYTIGVTSFGPGATGDYELTVYGVDEIFEVEGQRFPDPVTETGQLEEGDRTRNDKYIDYYTCSLQTGDQVAITLNSDDFDTYLTVDSPSGQAYTNDDGGSGTNSRLEFTADENGTYTIGATSYSSGAEGEYELAVYGVDEIDLQAGNGDDDDNGTRHRGHGRHRGRRNNNDRNDNTEVIEYSGRLQTSDNTLDDGSYYDEYTVDARRGQRIQVSMTSDDFDTYLRLITPDDEVFYDDDGGEELNSLLTVTATESGEYIIQANGYSENDTGRYDLVVTIYQPGQAEVIRGRLQHGDLLFEEDDSYYDEYSFYAEEGDQIDISMTSDDFDTFLMVDSPSGERFYNDDGADGTNSTLGFPADESGEYLIMANSYEAGETGRYELEVCGAQDLEETQESASSSSSDYDDEDADDEDYDDQDYDEDDAIIYNGRLQRGDEVYEDGSYYDEYSFRARRGDDVAIELTSDDFDTYLFIMSPSGEEQSDDDGAGGTNSRLEFTVDESGEYTVWVNSYSAGETGRYELAIYGAEE
ncbi:MAG: PPC domain-containing protein [Sedimentisphaerales bacterium]|nr:PPC domain-containing protein [Sedimentisphaerales bacterium]